MKVRPIIFGAESVRAILAGRKTQTRRVDANLPPEATRLRLTEWGGVDSYIGDVTGGDDWMAVQTGFESFARCPYGRPGDRLWVRETWRGWNCAWSPERQQGWAEIEYRADEKKIRFEPATRDQTKQARVVGQIDVGVTRDPWRPPIFLPRWASRLTLEVVSVRVERLQKISLGDIRAEGAEEPPLTPGVDFCIDGELWPAGERKIRSAFGAGWDSINGKRAPWGSNPWVWVVEFKVAS